jgi:hypothetical protein
VARRSRNRRSRRRARCTPPRRRRKRPRADVFQGEVGGEERAVRRSPLFCPEKRLAERHPRMRGSYLICRSRISDVGAPPKDEGTISQMSEGRPHLWARLLILGNAAFICGDRISDEGAPPKDDGAVSSDVGGPRSSVGAPSDPWERRPHLSEPHLR